MKHMKKLGSLLLVLVMALALTVPAMAAVTFVDPPRTDHTYSLYKIFDADLDGASLTNFKWNSDRFNMDAFVAEMAKLSNDTDATKKDIGDLFSALNSPTDEQVKSPTDEQVAEALDAARRRSEAVAGAEVAKALNAEGVSTTDPAISLTTPVGPGYYMIIDTPPAGAGAPVYSLYKVVQEDGTINIKDKSTQETTEVSKLVKNADGEWVYAADYEIGKPIDFQLSAPIKGYKADGAFNVVFHDMMDSNQLEVPAKEDITVYVQKASSGNVDVTSFTFDAGLLDESCEDNCAFHISFDVAALGASVQDGDLIVVEYTSQLLEGAALGTTGNTNGVRLDAPDGKHPGNDVIVYTFNLVASKVDGKVDGKEEKPLPGAVFELTTPDGTKVQLGTPIHKDGDGNPILSEAGELLYIVGYDEENEPILSTTGMTNFTFPTLAEGEYILKEIEAPVTAEGKAYNPVGPFYFKVETRYNTTNGLDSDLAELVVTPQPEKGGESLVVTVNQTSTTANMTTSIVNNTGLQMPETGGIGTTIFYIAGGVLVLGAVILLITKRRMHADEE